ncbi:MAG: sensor histidine kinase [Caulobacteraceae bacterium]
MPDIAKTAARTGVRRAWIGVGVPIVALVVVIIMLAVATFASFARDQDRAFTQASTTLVANGLAGRARAEGDIGLDYANWNEAFEHISARWDQDWVEGNIYSSVAEGMILFRADGAVRFNWFNEEFAPQAGSLAAAAVEAATKIPHLRRLARAPTPAETVGRTYTRIGDQLIVVAVAPITLEDNAARIAPNPLGGYDYLAVVEVITAQDMARASASMSLDDFRFTGSAPQVSHNMIAFPVISADRQRVGELQWRNTRPGAAYFQRSVGPVILGLLCIGALTLLIARQLVVRQIGAMAHGEAALESSRLKAEFLAKVGHELRTPLNGIIGYAEIIQEETDSAIAREDADRIIAAARHLEHLLNDILDQSRLDAGRINVKREVLPVAGMLAEVQGLAGPLARTAGVTLSVQPCATANYIVADHVRLRQCLLNLISNAVKFAPRGNVIIRTRVEARQGGDIVVFDIVDDGIGIAKSDLENLFKPFSQANEHVSVTYGGTGLGLSISRDLARAMGGDVTVVSELNKGSTFSLLIPVASASALRAA